MSEELTPSPQVVKASSILAGLKEDRSKLDRAIVASFSRQHPGSFDRNWIADFPHENGMYECICIHCTKHFLGHKRRMVCFKCANAPAETKHE